MTGNREYKSDVFSHDAAFIIGTDMNLYEHQSTYNPNMPLRGLIYYVDTMEKRIKELRGLPLK